MLKVKFWGQEFSEDGRGYGVLDKDGNQVAQSYPCKEVFATRLMMSTVKDGTKVIRFLYKVAQPATPEFMKRQEKILHAFEKKLGFEVLAKVETISNEKTIPSPYWEPRTTRKKMEHYVLYTVSSTWAKNIPLAHILALIVRNRYDTGRVDWRTYLNKLVAKKKLSSEATLVAKEIIQNKGEVDVTIINNGISSYASLLMRKRQSDKAF